MIYKHDYPNRLNIRTSTPGIIETIKFQVRNFGNIPDFLRRFKIGKKICKGTFAEVYSAKMIGDETEMIYAVKRVIKTKGKRINPYESEIHFKLRNHPNIINIFEYHESKNLQIFLLEYVKSDLHTLIRTKILLTDFAISSYTLQIATALYFMYKNGIMHRDIKSENILINLEDSNDGTVKLCDFGFATYSEQSNRRCGTIEYMAPEIFITECCYNYKVDIWALGIVIFEMYFIHTPFINNCNNYNYNYNNYKQIAHSIVYDDLVFPKNNRIIPHSAKNLISKLLVKDSDNRIDYIRLLADSFLDIKKIY